jgi:hypothetical protein
MKTGRMLALELLIATVAAVAGVESPIDECVDVYLKPGSQPPLDVLNMAEKTTAAIFNEIGIAVRWAKRPYKPVESSCTAVEMQFDRGSALVSGPDTIGYALLQSKGPSQVHIMIERVLRCRFACFAPSTKMYEAAFLGHVMAHEIGHVLQGVARHSEDGLMKGNWTHQDVLSMVTRRLSFTKSDADLIYRGFLSRRETETRESFSEP